MKRIFVCLAAVALACACTEKEAPVNSTPQPAEVTILKVGLKADVTKTTLGPSDNGTRKVYWSNGDIMSLNGTSSNPLSGVAADANSAVFTFPGVINPPFKLLYPASFYVNENTISLPSQQSYAAGSFATETAPLVGYVANAGDPAAISHLCSIIQLSVKKDPSSTVDNIKRVIFRGLGNEQVSGSFSIDYTTSTITPASTSADSKLVMLTVNQSISTSSALDLFIVVPAGEYPSGFSVELEDNAHHTMVRARNKTTTLTAGKLAKMAEFTFTPSATVLELTLEDVQEEVLPIDDYNITGKVVDNSGNGVENVVVSDGLQCVRTCVDGSFYLNSDITKTKFVYISTPSGYLPPVDAGKPRFYKLLADVSPSGGIYDMGEYVLTPVANPDTFTLFMTADPQPRATSLSLDNVAFRSTRACESLYLDLQETAAKVSGRQVYGICLGDLVHEDMDLMDTYSTALGTLGYPTYNIIGNHDNDIDKADDDAGAWKFESLFGPRNYSFNIGGIHFVVLDNLIMKLKSGGKLTEYDQGLTDDIWAWLQADMSYIPTSTTVMVCAHSPMFKQESGSERTNTAKHGGSTNESEGGAYGYGDLFDKYDNVHAWAGHTHSTFNFIYSSSHRHKNVEVHTLARSTGELWTNEYLANGTPRGFTIVEVENGAVKEWRFHPTKYLKSSFHGTHGQPSYTYCDYTFSGSPLVAKMKDTGEDLDESYQMHVFAPDAYGDGKLYVNVFLWDSKWQNPTLTMQGGSPVTMTLVENVNVATENRVGYDIADKEIKQFYYTNYSLLRSAGYDDFAPGVPLTMFSVNAPATGTGTVSVTDRFGNTYTRTVSW